MQGPLDEKREGRNFLRSLPPCDNCLQEPDLLCIRLPKALDGAQKGKANCLPGVGVGQDWVGEYASGRRTGPRVHDATCAVIRGFCAEPRGSHLAVQLSRGGA